MAASDVADVLDESAEARGSEEKVRWLAGAVSGFLRHQKKTSPASIGDTGDAVDSFHHVYFLAINTTRA